MSIGGIFLYKSYAYYENEKEYNVIKGIIPDFSYDVKFAIEVDGTKQDNIPTTPKGAGKANYYKVTADCDDGIKAEWDYNAWNLKVDNITKGTKCTLAFNSTLTETDYQKYIEAGVSYRRNTYRGKDITSKLTDGSLFKEIESGHFDDIFVGDYIKTNNQNHQVTWLIADLDNYLGTGTSNNKLTTHHATIIPAAPLTKAQMNSTATTNGGYAGSQMYTTTLPSVLSTYIIPVFNNHILKYGDYLSNSIKNDANNRMNDMGSLNKYNGATNGWKWTNNIQLGLMSEISVYGSIVWSSGGFDTGIDNRQYAIFRLKPEFINSDGNGNYYNYWLRDIASGNYFAAAGEDGTSNLVAANRSDISARPRFLID